MTSYVLIFSKNMSYSVSTLGFLGIHFDNIKVRANFKTQRNTEVSQRNTEGRQNILNINKTNIQVR
jgi:hypothetical protein